MFVSDLATYFMEFLETDFHKHRLPKRSIKYHDSKGLFLGLNVRKYEGCHALLWRVIKEDFQKESHFTVKRGQYTTRIPTQISDLIKRQVEEIQPNEIERILTSAVEVLKKESSDHRTEVDVALNETIEQIENAVRDVLIKPLLESVEKPIRNQSTSAIESIVSIEDGLTEVLVSSTDDIISECINSLIARQSCDVRAELGREFNIETFRSKILEFFDTLSINDLYFEFQELLDNKHILDKTEIYLYFGDIQYSKNVYPIFYVPLSIEKKGDMFSIILDSSIYINKKALEYIVQEFNKESGRYGRIAAISQRILYPREHAERFLEVIQSIFDDLADYFQLSEKLNLQTQQRQVIRGAAITLSNSCHFCIFDRSDEALVNDYEEILEALSSENNPLVGIFNKLIHAFIKEEPVRIRREIQDEWDKSEICDRLVYASPIPLNAEQRQILNAVKNEQCKFIAVEGPPGTGKSHTITAIVFDAIHDGKSTLVLSDKKEALDVVEDKLTETLNRVRFADKFQNPILRLGKTGSTYNQILSTTSIHDIEHSFRAIRNRKDALETNIKERRAKLQQDISQTAEVYRSIDLKDIYRFIQLDKEWGESTSCPVVVEEFDTLSADEQYSRDVLQNFVSSLENVDELLKDSREWGTLGDLLSEICGSTKGIRQCKGLVEFLNLLASLSDKYSSTLEHLRVFERLSNDGLKRLSAYIGECESLGAGWLGYLFKKKRLCELNERFNKEIKCREYIDVRKMLAILKASVSVLNDARAGNDNALISSLFAEGADYIETTHRFLSRLGRDVQMMDLNSLFESLEIIERFAEAHPRTAKVMRFDLENIDTVTTNALRDLDEDALSRLETYIALRSTTIESFNSLPQYDYKRSLEELEELLTHEMTYLLDKRLLDFYENNTSTAKTLRDNIRLKTRFPKEEFRKLKEAFPCIIAGIRDYAEFIPLESEIFDLVIIDEASQVSIAQAFPALIRAKKVMVLGDRRQFSNVKSAHARSDTNRDWLSRLDESFRTNVSTDLAELQRLTKFNIKTSILEFFEFIANYDLMLLKHFRGYREHISYSSKYFYRGNLQAVKIRGKPIDEVIKFTNLEHNGKLEPVENTNALEVSFIIEELRRLKAEDVIATVGVITPHTNQQKLIASEISKLPDRDYYYDKLKLKVMTFDTCQGEERDIVYYSMVANPASDRLWGVFPKDLTEIDLEESGQIKAQRLNVGLSRVKEQMHFVLSKPIEQFKGAIREALQHYSTVLTETKRLPETCDVDQTSPMEAKLLEWIKNTKFFQMHSSVIELRAQFPIGEYLRQLDKSYAHPKYRVDFLVIYSDKDGTQQKIIIEYDGFKEHFEQYADVNEFNYTYYYKDDDIEREKTLEGYGYKFIRVNRFNLGKDPVQALNARLVTATKKRASGEKLLFTSDLHEIVNGMSEGTLKVCPKCGEVKPIADYRDLSLSSGEGRICRSCKKMKRTHVVRALEEREAKSHRAVESASVKCPMCKSSMVLRTGRYGRFFGCSRYPKCRGTRQYS